MGDYHQRSNPVQFRSPALPPIESPGTPRMKREQMGFQTRKPALPSLATSNVSSTTPSPASPYSGPPPPYNFSANTSSGPAPSVAFLTSTSDTRKPRTDEKISLPSISEALANGPLQLPASSASVAPPHTGYEQTSPQTPNAPSWKAPGKSEPYPTSFTRSSTHPVSRESYGGHVSPGIPISHSSYKRVSLENHNSVPAEHQQPSYAPQPTGPVTQHRNPQRWAPQMPVQYEAHPQASGPRPPPQYSYSQPAPHDMYLPPHPPTAFPGHMESAAVYSSSSFPPKADHVPTWHHASREMSPSSDHSRRPRASYGESVKRHLDSFDLESSLNEIVDCSKRLSDFGGYYCQRAHQTQKSGPLPGATPSIGEIDEMVQNASQIQDSLVRLREVIVSQQAALAERSKDQTLHKAIKHALPEDGLNYQDCNYPDQSKDAGFGGNDTKKRRGRAAPPGRCHSCHRAETPEWRRGPDGARTLCNACGLHYAKLTRKMGAQNKAPIAISNLRALSMGPSSPTM